MQLAHSGGQSTVKCSLLKCNMSVNNKQKKIIIFNSYGVKTGGGSQIQAGLQQVVSKYIPCADVQILSLVKNTGRITSYLQSFLNGFKCYRKDISADLFILQSYLDPGMIVLGTLARKRRTPYILIPGGDLVPSSELFFKVRNSGLKWTFWLLFGKYLVNNASAVIVTSELEKQRLIKVGANPKRFHIIPNSLQPQFYQEAVEYLQISSEPASPQFVLWLGRISDEKGLLFLVECWKRVVSTCPQAKLFLVGPADHQGAFLKLRKSVVRLGLMDSIRFLPWVDEQRKIELLSQARCLVLPSYCESFGLTAMEAIVMRTPVIASTGTPWPQINDGAGSWLAHDQGLWVSAMVRYLSSPTKQYIDEEIVARLLLPYEEPVILRKWGAVLKSANI